MRAIAAFFWIGPIATFKKCGYMSNLFYLFIIIIIFKDDL